MGDNSPAAYIHMVHNLIEECLLFNMSKRECVEILSKRADIQPIITSTVWNQLEIENKDFFETYQRHREERRAQMEMKQRTSKDVSDSANDQSD